MAFSISSSSLVLLTLFHYPALLNVKRNLPIVLYILVVTSLQIPEQIFALSKTVGTLSYWILPWSKQQNKIDHFLVSGFQPLVFSVILAKISRDQMSII